MEVIIEERVIPFPSEEREIPTYDHVGKSALFPSQQFFTLLRLGGEFVEYDPQDKRVIFYDSNRCIYRNAPVIRTRGLVITPVDILAKLLTAIWLNNGGEYNHAPFGWESYPAIAHY